MELFESHFSKLNGGNLYFNKEDNSYTMFSGIGEAKHLNYLTFRELFRNLTKIKDPIILESGISCWGTHSTHLFNEYVRVYGGRFWSVDINDELVKQRRGDMCPATTLISGDSAQFFQFWAQQNSVANVIYLDSWDVDWYNPHPCAEHGLKEYKALLPVIKENTLLLIDDTPSSPYWLDTRGQLYSDMMDYYGKNNCLPGKAQYILKEPKNADLLMHNYQVLYKFK
jgi:hypothetical protein